MFTVSLSKYAVYKVLNRFSFPNTTKSTMGADSKSAVVGSVIRSGAKKNGGEDTIQPK